MLKIIALCSGAGGTIQTIERLVSKESKGFNVSFEVITDRECGALEWGKDHAGVKAAKMDWHNEQDRLRNYIESQSPCIVLTFIHRILSPRLLSINRVSYINTHYSLLPSFGGTIGMKSLVRALDAGALILGSTSHTVTTELDAGPIIAQAAFARKNESLEELSQAMFECGCLSTLLAIKREANMDHLFDRAISNYTAETARQLITGLSEKAT
jgi:phosphoribosylglycinamide formyltransferase-1